MKRAADPIGPENDAWLRRIGEESHVVLASWGANGAFLNRDEAVIKMFPQSYCLKMTESGHPHHPLHLKKETVYQPFRR